MDITKCPSCGGVADNGHDRCYPPNPYYCTKCSETPIIEEKIFIVDKICNALPDDIVGKENSFNHTIIYFTNQNRLFIV